MALKTTSERLGPYLTAYIKDHVIGEADLAEAALKAKKKNNRPSMPKLHHRIVKHLIAKGFPSSKAWPIAVEAVAKGCLLGISSLPGDKGKKVKLGKKARAEYCKAYAQWKKNHKGTGFGKKIGRG